ncbi:hypothetical protein PCE1_001111 [Barthelona sp. PCE]
MNAFSLNTPPPPMTPSPGPYGQSFGLNEVVYSPPITYKPLNFKLPPIDETAIMLKERAFNPPPDDTLVNRMINHIFKHLSKKPCTRVALYKPFSDFVERRKLCSIILVLFSVGILREDENNVLHIIKESDVILPHIHLFSQRYILLQRYKELMEKVPDYVKDVLNELDSFQKKKMFTSFISMILELIQLGTDANGYYLVTLSNIHTLACFFNSLKTYCPKYNINAKLEPPQFIEDVRLKFHLLEQLKTAVFYFERTNEFCIDLSQPLRTKSNDSVSSDQANIIHSQAKRTSSCFTLPTFNSVRAQSREDSLPIDDESGELMFKSQFQSNMTMNTGFL